MFAKQKIIGWLLGILLCNVLKAQLPLPVNGPCGETATISGVVNTYYPGLNNVNAGDISIQLGPPIGNTAPLFAGDRVLIIQMQDATINDDNTAAYGGNGTEGNGYTDLGYTGLFEFAQVNSFAGGVLTLRNPLQRSYRAVSGIPNRKSAYQVVRVPVYQQVTLSGTVAAAPWDGRAGGVVAFHAWQTVNMNGNEITATALGFRPGRINSAGGLYNLQDYVRLTYGSYGEKGEGIAGTPLGSWAPTAGGYGNGSFARGAPANAGGGGNAHNSGGGGGANFGDGGKGGYQYSGPQDVGGRGGKGVKTGLPGRIIMGGGGGGGHQNNAAATGGGHGGGIIIITANLIFGAGTFSADGESAGPSADDGAGGGGAGGSIMLSYTGGLPATIAFTARGGAGGNETFLARHGSGGGGGGGVVVSSTPVTANVTGGLRGLSNGTEWGTVDGEAGTTLDADLSPLQPVTTLIPTLELKDTTVCAPTTVDLTRAGVIVNRDQGPEFVLSYWADILTTIPVPNPQAISQSGTYYIKLTNSATKCEITAATQVTVHTQPVLTLDATPPSCNGGSDGQITATAGNGTGPYQYSSDGGLSWQNVLAGNLTAGTYTILARDSYGCISQPVSVTLADPPLLTIREEAAGHVNLRCNGDQTGQLQFTASGGTNGYLYTLTSSSTPTISNNTGLFTGLPAGTYTVTVTDAEQCSSTIEAVIPAPAPLLLEVKDTSVCAPVTIDITGSNIITNRNQGPEFALSFWTDAGTTTPLSNPQAVNQSGTYYIKLTNTITTCERTEPVQVTIHPRPGLLLRGIPPSCAGGSDGRIIPTVLNGSTPYQFSLDGGLNWQNVLSSNLPAGTYTVIVMDRYGCISQPAFITLADPPELTFREEVSGHADVNCHGAQGGQLQFSAAGGTNGYVYTVTSPATGVISNNTGLFTGLPAGVYTASVTDAGQCTRSVEAVILEPPQLYVALVSKTDLECDVQPKGSIVLTASGGIAPYSFRIGNGGWQTDSVFTGLTAGQYDIVVRDANNCETGPLSTEIVLVESCDIYFPSAFTPNGDGLNDLFRPKYFKHVTNYRLDVYNRWGAAVFQTNDPSRGWDGRFKGVLSDTGTFMWVATFTDRHGQAQSMKGTVTLVK